MRGGRQPAVPLRSGGLDARAGVKTGSAFPGRQPACRSYRNGDRDEQPINPIRCDDCYGRMDRFNNGRVSASSTHLDAPRALGASAAPVSFEWRLARSTGHFDAFLKRLQMRHGGIFSRPSADDPDAAVRIIDSLNPIDAMSWDNSIPVHLGNMPIIGHRTQLNQRLTAARARP